MSEPMELTGVKAKAMALRIIADLLAESEEWLHWDDYPTPTIPTQEKTT